MKRDELDAMAEDGPLWNLLGQAGGPVDVSPFFARNVVRAVRCVPERREPWALARRWLRGAVAGLGALGAAAFFACCLLQPPHSSFPAGGAARAQSFDKGLAAGYPPGDVEVIQHLDELLSLEETTLWLGPSASSGNPAY